MPDHLHTIWTLPACDTDAAGRWQLIKARFSASLPRIAPSAPLGRGSRRLAAGILAAPHPRCRRSWPCICAAARWTRCGTVWSMLPEAWPYSSFRSAAARSARASYDAERSLHAGLHQGSSALRLRNRTDRPESFPGGAFCRGSDHRRRHACGAVPHARRLAGGFGAIPGSG